MKSERGTSSSTDPRSITSLDYCPKQYKKSVYVCMYTMLSKYNGHHT